MDTLPATLTVNGTPLSDPQRGALEAAAGAAVPDGRYWYDAACGAWGLDGSPVLGFTAPGLNLPGPMPEDCSGGGTGTWINGRELHPQDRMALIGLFGACAPGRFWLDAQGNLGPEGGPAFVNLFFALRSQGSPGNAGGVVSGLGGLVGFDGSGGVSFFGRNPDGSALTWSN